MGLFRVTLALAVFAVHSRPIFGANLFDGDIAVQTFFIVSGFYMGMVLNEKYASDWAGYRTFLVARTIRLLPAYALFICARLLQLSIQDPAQLAQLRMIFGSLGTWEACFAVLSNITMLGQDLFYFLIIDNDGTFHFAKRFTTDPFAWPPQLQILMPAWSLSIEIWFYLIAPFIARRSLWIISLIVVLSFSLRLALYAEGLDHDPWVSRFFPTELALFLMGTLGYRMNAHIKCWRSSPCFRGIAWVMCAILFIWTIRYQHIQTYEGQPNRWIYFIFVSVAIPWVFELSRHWKWDRFIGELSYPIYLGTVGTVAFFVCLFLEPTQYPTYALSWLALLLNIMLAAVIVWRVELPIDRFRQRLASRATVR